MFNIYYLTDGKWIVDQDGPFKGPRKKLATGLRETCVKQWKIRKVQDV